MGRVVAAVQVVAAVAAVAFVVGLFANEPAGAPTGQVAVPGDAAGQTATPTAGASVFAANCARCHGDGGQGGIGPRLAGGAVVERFPRIADQVAVVTEGRGGMPGFADRLTPDEIRAVVEYTRTLP